MFIFFNPSFETLPKVSLSIKLAVFFGQRLG
jgi:hypothetical protein